MRRLLPLLVFLSLVVEDARASCAPPNPRGHIKYADAAFDGRFESERTDGQSRWLTFRVDRVLKGELASTVEIYERGISTINLGRFAPGERVGLTLNFKDGAWITSDCQRYDPEELADAFKPIPRPPGRGRAAYLVTGSFGTAGGVLLDRRARTIAYLFHGAWKVSVCPGGRRFAVLGNRIDVLRTRDLRVVDSARAGFTQRIHCLGRVVVRATSSGLFRGNRRIWRGRWKGIAFHGRYAFVSLDDVVSRVDLVTGAERALAGVAVTGDPVVSPDGRRLAVSVPPSHLGVIDVRSGRVRTTHVPEGYNGIAWIGRDRLATVIHPHFRAPDQRRRTRFFDASLRPQGELGDWSALPAVGVDGAMVGLFRHRVERAANGGVSELGRLPSSMTGELHRLPGVRVRASRRVPRY